MTSKKLFRFYIHTFLCQANTQVTHLDSDDGLELLILDANGFGGSLSV